MNIDDIKKIKTIEDIQHKVFIYGESGTGKTRSAATFPNPYFFDFDGGMLSVREELVAGKINGKTYGQDEWRKFRKDWDALVDVEKPEYDTYVLDSLTSISEAIEYYVMKQKGNLETGMELQQYKLTHRRLCDLMYKALKIRANVVVLAHVETVRSDAGLQLELPLVTGKKFPEMIPMWFDTVAKQGMKRNKEKGWMPTWTCSHSNRFKAKCRLGRIEGTITPTYESYMSALKTSQ